MLNRLLVPILIFALCGFPVDACAAPDEAESRAPSNSPNDSQTLRASVNVDSATGRIVPAGTGDGQGHLVAIEVTHPEALKPAVQRVKAELIELEERAGAVSDGVDELAVITNSNDDGGVLQSAVSGIEAKRRDLITQPLEHFLAWKPLTFRITVVGITSLIAGGASYLQMCVSTNPLEAAVAFWVAPYVTSIIMLVEWQNLRMKTFVQQGKGVIVRLFELFTFHSRNIETTSKTYHLLRMAANNTEINIHLFAVFKFILLTAISLRTHGTIDDAIAALPGSFRWAYIGSILSAAVGGTAVAFPMSQYIYTVYDQEKLEAGEDQVLVDRARNSFQLKASGALALRALCMVSIILGVNDLVNGGFAVLPTVAVGCGVAGMAAMFRFSVRKLGEIAYLKSCAGQTVAATLVTANQR